MTHLLHKVLFFLMIVYVAYPSDAQTLISADTLYPYNLEQNDGITEVIFSNANILFEITGTQDIDLLKDAIKREEPVLILYDSGYNVVAVTALALSRRQLFEDRYAILRYEDFEYKDDRSFKSNARKLRREIADEQQSLKEVIPIAELDSIFAAFTRMSCSLSQTCDVNQPCIPFDFKSNGCYARAHYMRKLLAENYGYDCKKIFSYGRLYAKNSEPCSKKCIKWGWHVAPLVNVQLVNGDKVQLVVDPSLFSKPVPRDEWVGAQQSDCGRRRPQFNRTEVKSADAYGVKGSLDADYSNTMYEMRRFCGECK